MQDTWLSTIYKLKENSERTVGHKHYMKSHLPVKKQLLIVDSLRKPTVITSGNQNMCSI